MIRRSFRIGLWLGVVAALAYMAARTRQRSRPAGTGTEPWPPIEPGRTEAASPAAPVPAPIAPAEPAPERATPAAPPPTEAPRPPAAKKRSRRKKKAAARAWVEPSGDGCPDSHPLKAKESSKIFHVPGGLSYDRTQPDRCYGDEAAAKKDGYRQAKR